METTDTAQEQGNVGISNEDRLWATFVHLSSLIGFLIPLGNILGPLVIWLVKKNESPFVDQHGKEAVNFQISLLIYFIISLILLLVFIGILLMFAIAILWLVTTIIGAIKANNGETYQYPLTIRFIS